MCRPVSPPPWATGASACDAAAGQGGTHYFAPRPYTTNGEAMAIADVKEYSHLTEDEVEQIGRELDALRTEIEESRGAADAAYINRLIRIQRGLAFAGRVTLLFSNKKPAWAA